MKHRILITGASGLIGTAVSRACISAGLRVRHLDLRGLGDDYGDVRDSLAVARAIRGCDGVIHLAAVSRVSQAERAPERCESINVGGTQVLLDAALASPKRPWFILASSREVYGDGAGRLLTEDAPRRPKNVYGQSKLAAEQATCRAEERGLRAAALRFANVYGSAQDYHDRVIPAFLRAALSGQTLRVDGPERAFDFTHVNDVADTVLSVARRLQAGAPAPETVHLTTGVGVTLGQLARKVIAVTRSQSNIRAQSRQAYDVTSFVGCPLRAQRVVGWEPKISLDAGLVRLAGDLRRLGAAIPPQELLP